MSSEATNWVRDRYDGPASTVAVLFVIATYTDREGRGCRASIATIATGANKGVRQVKKDLAVLRKEGVIAPGDQRLVAHLHPEQRPVVYDLPALADLVNSSSPPRGTGRHRSSGLQGQNPVVSTTPKTSPSERDRAGRAQGSAQRTGDAASTHFFSDDGSGGCVHCPLPELNSRHLPGASDGTSVPNPPTLLPDLRAGQGSCSPGADEQPGPQNEDHRGSGAATQGARPAGEDRADDAARQGVHGDAEGYRAVSLPGGRVISFPVRAVSA